jgi:putative ABC transport system permease protein
MSVRERTTEIAVMRTLGFPSQIIFFLIAGEGLLISVAGGVLGAGLAWLIVNGQRLGLSGGFVPLFGVSPYNASLGVLISIGIGLVAGLVPAVLASRLKIIDALRRVA